MTLLESIVGLVILSLCAVGVLGIFGQANSAEANARTWSIAAAYAEEGVEAAKIGRSGLDALSQSQLPRGYTRRIDALAAPKGLSDVLVTVTLPDGATLQVHRLVAAR